MLLYTFPIFSPYQILQIASKIRKCINTPLVTQNIVDFEEYKIEKPPKSPLVTEYKGVHCDFTDKCLQTDGTMSIAATLTSKERFTNRLCNASSSYSYL